MADVTGRERSSRLRQRVETSRHPHPVGRHRTREPAATAQPGGRRGGAGGRVSLRLVEDRQTPGELSFEPIQRTPESHEVLAQTGARNDVQVFSGELIDAGQEVVYRRRWWGEYCDSHENVCSHGTSSTDRRL
jgi:hypothetical protein